MARQRTPEGPPPPPAVQKLRVRYAKRGRLRFSSTRDFQRALERAVRRAGVPMAFSAGFHPHPKISYANAAPTGTASEAEYFELSVVERVDAGTLRAALDEALPEGLVVLEVVEAGPGTLAERLEASEWLLEFRDVTREALASAVDSFLAVHRAEVSRTFKTGPKTFDVRSAIVSMQAMEAPDAPSERKDGSGYAILRVVVRHTTPAVRPDDVLTALRAITEFSPPILPRVTRLAQGPLEAASAGVADPLAADKNAAGD